MPFFLVVVAAAEWYAFQAVRTLVQGVSPGARRATVVLYWLVTALVWGLGIWAMSNRRAHASYKSYLGGLLLAVIAAKMVVIIPLLLEDVVRVGRWASPADRAAQRQRFGHGHFAQ